ncbi:hypothetical protein MSKOL_0114 [Methanosarcina sp. Kolksee]|uniref:hypothetical protein n=1 Tax=Methanosarcina sp. Kolksee TaxID=1434099 RepID=UPI0006158738|nr:hypothetical protein [Methanosarcina sp. Kolksee]AKB45891.1 hypothetical protein MSKOL_0114 [Methanosarcina sp. Kolksee]
MQKDSDFEINPEVISFSEDSIAENENEKNMKETEEFEAQAAASIDSRTYEHSSFFLGIPLIIIIGGIRSSYESVFSIEYKGKNVVVLYNGICLVSVADRLFIHGKWDKGKRLGIQGNVVVADRIENLSSGLVFSHDSQ